jgi:hypothetical protein
MSPPGTSLQFAATQQFGRFWSEADIGGEKSRVGTGVPEGPNLPKRRSISSPRDKRQPYTRKQMGDAGEMLVAAELTLHGIPAFLVPSNWPDYDVVAQTRSGLQRISVKTGTFARSGHFVGYGDDEKFDWLAIVVLPGEGYKERGIFIVPYDVAQKRSYEAKYRKGRGFFVHRLIEAPRFPLPHPVPTGGCGLADYKDNFGLVRRTDT